MRALRLLSADVSDLSPLGRGDGLAARADLSDEGGYRGARGRHAVVCAALRCLSGLSGVCDRLSVRCAVRAADRSDARADRADVPETSWRLARSSSAHEHRSVSVAHAPGDAAAARTRSVDARDEHDAEALSDDGALP